MRFVPAGSALGGMTMKFEVPLSAPAAKGAAEENTPLLTASVMMS